MWLRWNETTNIFEKSLDDGATWDSIQLDAIILTQGVLAAARIPPITSAMLAGSIPASKLILTDIVLPPRVGSIGSASPLAPNVDVYDFIDVTALAVDLTWNNPIGTPANTQKLTIRIKDDGTARGLSWDTAYENGGADLPSTTIAGKTMTLGFIYNTANALNKWQCVAISLEF